MGHPFDFGKTTTFKRKALIDRSNFWPFKKKLSDESSCCTFRLRL